MAYTLKQVSLNIPASPKDIAALEIGSIVYLNGVVYTAREGVYDMVMNKGRVLPNDLKELSNVNFHCSPAAAPNEDGGYTIGGVTATASFRFSKQMPEWLDISESKIIIGKGGMRKEDYKNVLAPRKVVYLSTVGYGTGALLGRGVKNVHSVHWLDELGIAQALWMFQVKNFGPFIVDSDIAGNSLFINQGELVNQNIDKLYEGLREPALHRYGETDDRKDELM